MSTEIQKWSTPPDYVSAWRHARALAASALVPKHLKSQDHDATTATVITLMQLAGELGVSVVSLMQHTHVVGDKVGYSAAFMLARINASKRFKGGVQFRTTGTPGKDLRTVAYGLNVETGETIEAPAITWDMAVAEGWTRNPKYKSMPEVMFTYRAASLFARLYCADLLFGAMTSAEELPEPAPMTIVESTPVKMSRNVAAMLGRKAEADDADLADLEERLRSEVAQGAEESYVRAACEESGLCSPEFVEKLVGRLFPKGEEVAQ